MNVADCAAMKTRSSSSLLGVALLVAGCQPAPEIEMRTQRPDPHSFAESEVRVRHLNLDLDVDFERRQLSGSATLTLDHRAASERLVLDTAGLTVHSVTLLPGDRAARFELLDAEPHLGQALVIGIEPDTERVKVDYATSPDAAALQWLAPTQTDSGKPFLFTQSQAILARSWVPCQDTPGVRMTYEARVRVPADLMAVMSAENTPERASDGVYRFSMPQAIPSYLLALAVGDLAFRELGPRSGVYAEPGVVDKAAYEFAEVEAMMEAAEGLYGPYRWGRYDILVLPPSFPFGGMENPRLTFATPTILAGDRSLVALIAHELAHSWSGNLVTNATWDDFWLNEGFTVYFELRIMEAVKGAPYAEMLRALSLTDLREEVADLGPDSRDTHLLLDLAGRDPDDGMTAIAYDKGAGLLRRLEEYAGRDRWDEFLNDYFERHAFQSLDTAAFRDYLQRNLLDDLDKAGAPDLDSWISGPGIPADFPLPQSQAFLAVEAELTAWLGGRPPAELNRQAWTTHEWLHFIHGLPERLDEAQLTALDEAFGLTASGNAEIQAAWYQVAIENGYRAAYPAIEDFLLRVGRRKFLKPLYAALAANPDDLDFARRIYEKARPGYHSVSTGTIDEILGWSP